MNINKADLVNTLAQNNKAYKKYMVKDIVDDILMKLRMLLEMEIAFRFMGLEHLM